MSDTHEFPVMLGEATITAGYIYVQRSLQEQRLLMTTRLNGMMGKQRTDHQIRVIEMEGGQIGLANSWYKDDVRVIVSMDEWRTFAAKLDVQISNVSATTLKMTPELIERAHQVAMLQCEEPSLDEWEMTTADQEQVKEPAAIDNPFISAALRLWEQHGQPEAPMVFQKYGGYYYCLFEDAAEAAARLPAILEVERFMVQPSRESSPKPVDVIAFDATVYLALESQGWYTILHDDLIDPVLGIALAHAYRKATKHQYYRARTKERLELHHEAADRHGRPARIDVTGPLARTLTKQPAYKMIYKIKTDSGGWNIIWQRWTLDIDEAREFYVKTMELLAAGEDVLHYWRAVDRGVITPEPAVETAPAEPERRPDLALYVQLEMSL